MPRRFCKDADHLAEEIQRYWAESGHRSYAGLRTWLVNDASEESKREILKTWERRERSVGR